MKQYFPTGRRNRGRPLKRLLDAWDRNGSTSDPIPWQIDDDDDDDEIHKNTATCFDLHRSSSGSMYLVKVTELF